MTKNKKYLNRKLAIILSLAFSVLSNIFIFSKFYFFEHDRHLSDHQFQFSLETHHLIILFITDIFVYYLSYRFCFWVFCKKWRKNHRKYLAGIFGTFGVAITAGMLCLVTTFPFFQSATLDDFQGFVWSLILRNAWWASFFVFISTWAISAFVRNQQVLVENQQLIAENIRNRHEALKNQLNPHFLFNSLNTLDGLIGFDDEKAHHYLQNLSLIFRYTIQNKEITTLKDELDFVECYAYLMKIRYGDSLKIQYAIDEKYNLYCIMPVSLQMLIENAIKHNIINDRHPLTIIFETTDKDTIRVSNVIQPKIAVEAGEGIGLANLSERYHMLFGMDVLITKNEVFTVEIPLLKNHESLNN
jgi:Putative regulator of cell autolysis